MTGRNVWRGIFVFEAHRSSWFDPVIWKPVNRAVFLFAEDLGECIVRSPLYACNDVFRQVIEVLHELQSRNHQKIRWLVILDQGPNGKFKDDKPTVRVLFEFEELLVENGTCRACGQPLRTSDGASQCEAPSTTPCSSQVEKQVPMMGESLRETSEIPGDQTSGSSSTVVADKASSCEVPERELPDREHVSGGASPASARRNESSEAGSWVVWDAETADKA